MGSMDQRTGTVAPLALIKRNAFKLLNVLFANPDDTGWLRILGGVHYPTDMYAGRVLGQALARAFLASPAFQQDLAAVKAELSGAR